MARLNEFSLLINNPTVAFDSKIVPLLRQMSNLEKLTLCFRVRGRSSFIDGVYLRNEVLHSMTKLNRFEFDIVCDETFINSVFEPNREFIRRTLISNGYNGDCYVNYSPAESIGRCHLYSLPFTMNRIHRITSTFPGGNFVNVRSLRVFDLFRSFENSFFIKISHSFPMLTELSVRNNVERIEKGSWTSTKSKKASFIEYPHLTTLNLCCAHIDYVEQFIFNFNIHLPSLNKLYVKYDDLVSVTNNFTRNPTRTNCYKLNEVVFGKTIHVVHSKDFYEYFPCLQTNI